jgi:bifunctional non-homologous end joining protein LigD
MSLVKYKNKRRFNATPEPTGGKSSASGLRFMVQQHNASRLHYDFRLEMGGVLKSWAVPKGPSMDPKVKRLAVQVEDHPFDYRSFEGIIPSGNYGAGSVIVWDEGNYYPSEGNIASKKNTDKNFRHELHAGKIKFSLSGQKLKGDFALVKTAARGENAWLLMKLKDKYATTKDVLTDDVSEVSGHTIKELETAPTRKKTVKTARKKIAKKKTVPQKKNTKKKKAESSDFKEAKAVDFYKSVTPMLATLVNAPFNEPGWLYEIKWDGYRAVAFRNNKHFDIRSRNDKSFAEKFYPVYDAICKWKTNAIVDGEIVVLNKDGQPDFGKLQNWRSEADGSLVYYVFDLLWHEGKDITTLPLIQRRELLQIIVP